jgi:hypothetical protein
MSLLDRSHLYNFERPAGSSGFFDFQLAAVEHCVQRLQQGLPAVLGLDTGLGKTCTVGEVMRRLGGTALWISPGGLIRQTAQELRAPSCGLKDNQTPRVIVKAETGKELQDLRIRTEGYDVAVVNRALGNLRKPPPRADGSDIEFALTVVDEAHQMTSQLLRSYMPPLSRRSPLLLVSACARSSNSMMDAFRSHGSRRRPDELAREYGEACFIVDKTERVLRCIGSAIPRFVSVSLELSSKMRLNYLDCLLFNIKNQAATRTSIRVALTAGRFLDPKDEVEFVKIAAEHANARPVDDTIRNEVREAFFRLELPGAPSEAVDPIRAIAISNGNSNDNAIITRVAPSSSSKRRASSFDEDIVNKESSSSTIIATTTNNTTCQCCGLTSAEYRSLYRCHVKSLSADRPIWTINDKTSNHGFCSTLVRFPSARALDDAIKSYPPPPSLDVFVLTSAKSAAYRARLVKRFASHGGQRYKLCVLARAVKNSKCPPLLMRVLTIGGGFFHKELVSYIANPRILVTDQTVDVGFDLHRHIDGLTTSHVLCSTGDVQQLVGRLARISVDRIGSRDTIDVITPIRANTLDEFFAKHLVSESTIGEDEEVIEQRDRDRRRAEDRRLTSEMRTILTGHHNPELGAFFERLYSAAVTSGLT